jgi:uncharacterized DUF497 family protein
VEFEYDLKKSDINLRKHGIDFERAKLLWDDEKRLVVLARSSSEFREALIGMLDGVSWTAVYTFRASVIRIISVRRSRNEEIEKYHHS